MPLVLIMAIFIMVDYDYGEDTLHDIDENVDDMMMSKNLHCIFWRLVEELRCGIGSGDF